MMVKIFQAQGFDEIKSLDARINIWLRDELAGHGRVINMQTAMCQVAESPTSGERMQHLVVTLWYDQP
jgi:hypothetical protein